MGRRELLMMPAFLAALWSLAALGQQKASVPRIGFLGSSMAASRPISSGSPATACAAWCADQILKGAKSDELPVQVLPKFELMLHSKRRKLSGSRRPHCLPARMR